MQYSDSVDTKLQTLSLPDNEIHLWVGDLRQEDVVCTTLEKTLTAQEIARADRYAFPDLRQRFVVARGILRDILARYTGISAEILDIQQHAQGKPFLAIGRPRFNLSHSHELSIFLLSNHREVGVDVEYTARHVQDLAGLAQHVLSATETNKLFALPADQQKQAFFNAWTRKEAYVKALGCGLIQAPETIEVTLCPGETPRLLQVEGQPEAISRWHFEAFQYRKDYTIAAAVEGSGWNLRLWEWQPKSLPSPEWIMGERAYE